MVQFEIVSIAINGHLSIFAFIFGIAVAIRPTLYGRQVKARIAPFTYTTLKKLQLHANITHTIDLLL